MSETPETPPTPETSAEAAEQPVAVPEQLIPPALEEPPAPPPWVGQLRADLTAIQGQVAQWQAKSPTWFQQTATELPKKLMERMGLPAQLRQLEQRIQKTADKQMRQGVATLTRAVSASGKQLERQVTQQLKDLSRRLKDIEKSLAQVQRKLK